MKTLLYSALLTLITITATGQNCQPDFSYQTSGPAGPVYFFGYTDSMNLPSDSVTSWLWTFTGGGANYTATGQYPVVSLTQNTYYNVCLTINTQLGCTGTFCDSIFTGTPCNVYVSLSGINPTPGQCDGSITANAGGGTPPYFYVWGTGANTSVITNLCSGTYSVTVADAMGCTASGTAFLNDSTSNFCNAFFFVNYNPNGSVTLIDSSNTSSAITSWNWVIYDNMQNIVYTFTQQNPTFSTVTGTYTATLTINTASGTSCSYTYTFTVNNTSPCNLTATMDIIPVSVIGGSDGSIDLTVAGGTTPYTFMWSSGQTTEDISGLISGYYTVMVDDNDPACPSLTLTGYIYEPYDTTGGNYIIDTLTTAILDTCLNFTPDSFYISQIDIINNTTVLVTWTFMGGGAIQTLQVEYTFTANGNYMVMLTINCGSKTLTSYASYIHIHTTTTLNNIVEGPAVKLYPNPASGLVNIECTPPYTYTISSISGQIILASGSQHTLTTADISHLPAGLYIVTIENNGKTSLSRLAVTK